MKYYHYISGLPEIKLNEFRGMSTVLEIKNDLQQVLSKQDFKLLQMLFYEYDNKNLLLLLKNKDSQIDPKGNLLKEDWIQIFESIEEDGNTKDKRLPAYLQSYLTHKADEEDQLPLEISNEDFLSTQFYSFASKTSHVFLRKWFIFSTDVNNIITAFICRKHGFDLNKMVIGDNKITKALKQNKNADFGLGHIIEDFDMILRVADEQDPSERERKFDLLKWNWLEKHTEFEYFSIDKILAYVLQLQILERWKNFSNVDGKSVFSDLLLSLKQDVQVQI